MKKQLPVVLCWKSVFLLILWINRKAPASEPLIFNKLQAWGLQLYEKRDTATDVFLLILWNL